MSRHILMYIKARLGISRHILVCQGISWRVKANKTQGVAWHGTFGRKQLWHLIFLHFWHWARLSLTTLSIGNFCMRLFGILACFHVGMLILGIFALSGSIVAGKQFGVFAFVYLHFGMIAFGIFAF